MCTTEEFCDVCGQPLTWQHDHMPDLSGLDDGPELYPARKKAAPKPKDELRAMALDLEQWEENLRYEYRGVGPTPEYIAEIAAMLRAILAERERDAAREAKRQLIHLPD